jgi:hypothetical protein
MISACQPSQVAKITASSRREDPVLHSRGAEPIGQRPVFRMGDGRCRVFGIESAPTVVSSRPDVTCFRDNLAGGDHVDIRRRRTLPVATFSPSGELDG